MTGIRYKGGYKYQLIESYTTVIPIRPADGIARIDGFIHLDENGLLIIREGYAWDGPSGPTIDTKNFMRGSLVHDALYQLMSDGQLDPETCREPADSLLRAICREDGMSWIRAWWVYQGVRIGGASAARSPKEIFTAP